MTTTDNPWSRMTNEELWRQIVTLESKDRLSFENRDDLASMRTEYYRRLADDRASAGEGE